MESREKRVKVGQAWRDNRRESGNRVVVLTEVGPSYVRARSEAAPYRRTRIARRRLVRAYTLCGEMAMDQPEFWPDWFKEDATDA